MLTAASFCTRFVFDDPAFIAKGAPNCRAELPKLEQAVIRVATPCCILKEELCVGADLVGVDIPETGRCGVCDPAELCCGKPPAFTECISFLWSGVCRGVEARGDRLSVSTSASASDAASATAERPFIADAIAFVPAVSTSPGGPKEPRGTAQRAFCWQSGIAATASDWFFAREAAAARIKRGSRLTSLEDNEADFASLKGRGMIKETGDAAVNGAPGGEHLRPAQLWLPTTPCEGCVTGDMLLVPLVRATPLARLFIGS